MAKKKQAKAELTIRILEDRNFLYQLFYFDDALVATLRSTVSLQCIYLKKNAILFLINRSLQAYYNCFSALHFIQKQAFCSYYFYLKSSKILYEVLVLEVEQ